jgi:tryptophan 2,3-dioxygenase
VITVYISIGNSDDKLSQFEWSAFCKDTNEEVLDAAVHIIGIWFSDPSSPYQNCCWCISLDEVDAPSLKRQLARVAKAFRQDSIAWAVASTEFIGAAE